MLQSVRDDAECESPKRGALISFRLPIVLCLVIFIVWDAVPAWGQYGSGTQLGRSPLQLLQDLEGLRELAPQLQVPSEALDRARTNAVQGAGEHDRRQQGQERQFELIPHELELLAKFCSSRADVSMSVISFDRVSRLERDYCRRVGEPLLQFGYRNFAVTLPPAFLGVGALHDEYVLGVGDELIITFFGPTKGTHFVRVDREGRIVLPDLLPMAAAGRTLGEFRAELVARTKAAFLGTEVFISVGSVRYVAVSVVGEVANPGIHRLTALSTIFDAIALAGGIRKTGSLRKVIVQRGSQIVGVDLYDVLLTGVFDYQFSLSEGDRIFVPAIGSTVAVVGQVNRPGIYELPEGRAQISRDELLSYAGGVLRPLGQTFVQMSFSPDGREVTSQTTDGSKTLRAGDILMVRPRFDVQTSKVELAGHVRTPGSKALPYAPTVSALIGGVDSLRDDPYLAFAVLETTDPATQARRLFPINLERILNREEDFSLRDRDRLIVFSRDDIRFLMSTDVKNVLLGRPVAGLSTAPSALQELRRRARGGPPERDTDESRDRSNGQRSEATTQRSPRRAAPQTNQTARTNLASQLAQVIEQGGLSPQGLRPADEATEEERLPPMEPETCPGLLALASVVAVGNTPRFDNVILAGLSEELMEFDLRRECPQVFADHPDTLPFVLEYVAALNGEIRFPGAYPITPHTRLVSLISAAGGITLETDRLSVELSRILPVESGSGGQIRRTTVDISTNEIASTLIDPSDIVRFNARFTDRDKGPVVLVGEFVRPGLFTIRRGERLSELISRAGGLTAQAYPYGAILTRERVKQAEAQALRRAAREIDSALAVLATRRNVSAEQLAALSRLSEQLETAEAIGRVVAEIDPTVLQVRPELDTVLEAGDQIFVPKRPNYITVSGDVLNPTTVQFRPGGTVAEYIDKAGGFQVSGDDGRVFVVFPNGEARRAGVGLWNFEPVQIPPGSTIVVPRDPKPFDLLDFARDITPILSNLAVTAASLAVIGRN